MQPLVSLRDLTRGFTRRQGLFASRQEFLAVNRVNLDLFPGETLGLVGESGCGKSTLARMVVRLLPPTSGDVLFRGISLFHPPAGDRSHKGYRKTLCRDIQMVFQDPFSSLNPRMRIGESVAEPLLCTGDVTAGGPTAGDVSPAREREKIVTAMLECVGLGPDTLRRYPHEFSGGQRQRIAIARALVTRPRFVVCDEPTSSLDSSVQAQVLNLLAEFQEQFNLAYLFISHDLAVVRHMSDRVAVMYAGLIVEEGPAGELFAAPRHPYTRLLLDSEPAAPANGIQRHGHSGTSLPAATTALSSDTGCPFAPRCPQPLAHCTRVLPELTSPDSPERRIRCHNPL